ncbi:thiamine pyrophosphate-dependent enzyme [Streptomyces sp. NPDC056716]|uniref:thiamine pyrophosphate-dependent enzyme n=1 Tax=unclassified Streptomyces TaxID=2593676 RepID=UPI0036C3B9C3
MTSRTVRDTTLDLWRRSGLTRIFSNPGSTEITLLTDLPADFAFVLGLHEGSVVGMATGYALARDRPALVVLHTTAGLGNAVGALATARVNRAPLVVVVGQQDRRHLANAPFLSGRLRDLCGDYPVSVAEPARAADVPATLAQAQALAVARRGPALVVVPMNDWNEPYDDDLELAAPQDVLTAWSVDERAVDHLAGRLREATAPAIVAGADADRQECWTGLERVADALDCPVWQEPFGARAGFRQDAPRFAGHLPSDRTRLREALAGRDLVVFVGAPAVRQYAFDRGRLFAEGTEVIVVGEDLDDLATSTAATAVHGPLGPLCTALGRRFEQRAPATTSSGRAPATAPDPAQPMTAEGVFAMLAERLPADTIVIEESPSTRLALSRHLPARQPLGFLSAAMGGLGFALPAAVGLRMGRQDRPVLSVVGDGSAMYQIQALWSAQHYSVGVCFIVLSNGGYAIMDQLADRAGGKPPWPNTFGLRIDEIARGMGCAATRVENYAELAMALATSTVGLASASRPQLIDIVVR